MIYIKFSCPSAMRPRRVRLTPVAVLQVYGLGDRIAAKVVAAGRRAMYSIVIEGAKSFFLACDSIVPTFGICSVRVYDTADVQPDSTSGAAGDCPCPVLAKGEGTIRPALLQKRMHANLSAQLWSEWDTCRKRFRQGVPASTLATLYGQCSQALADVHSHEVAHGDIAARNLLTDKPLSDPAFKVYVADLGFAMPASGRFRRNLGKGQTAAPEIVLDFQDGVICTKEADMFALAMTFWELWSGVSLRRIGVDGWRMPTLTERWPDVFDAYNQRGWHRHEGPWTDVGKYMAYTLPALPLPSAQPAAHAMQPFVGSLQRSLALYYFERDEAAGASSIAFEVARSDALAGVALEATLPRTLSDCIDAVDDACGAPLSVQVRRLTWDLEYAEHMLQNERMHQEPEQLSVLGQDAQAQQQQQLRARAEQAELAQHAQAAQHAVALLAKQQEVEAARAEVSRLQERVHQLEAEAVSRQQAVSATCVPIGRSKLRSCTDADLPLLGGAGLCVLAHADVARGFDVDVDAAKVRRRCLDSCYAHGFLEALQ
jgi:Protein kinase domain